MANDIKPFYALRVDVCAADYFELKSLTDGHHGLQAEVLRKVVKETIKQLKARLAERQHITDAMKEGG